MRGALTLALATALGLAFAGCREEGAAEKAGRQVDEAIERLRHGDEGALERAGRKLDEAVDDTLDAASEAIEDLGEQVQGE